ncbi:MAG TPA: carbohydrate binding domain-containing protein [Victivallales bacterium]|nr:carbohydrate binding domain-containing protein [Victivallales bacterium]HRR05762.1 carbohydrate binding domain-containing protein [Victivallales bacterium]HRR29158.1 carbohydrate binding domain-containing protein [Victivallales bacterium]
MKKKIYFIAIVGMAICFARLNADNARIDVSGTKEGIKITVGAVSEKGSSYNASWMDAEKNSQYILMQLPVNNEWQQGKFSFTPDKDGKVVIGLMGEWKPKDPQNPQELIPVWILYDDIVVENAELKNGGFDGGTENWWLNETEGAQYVADDGHTGKGAVKVWHNAQAFQEIEVKAGKEVTITFWAKIAK